MAEELKFPMALIGVFVVYYLVVWVFPSISHDISGRELRIRWRILWRIPFGTRTIRIDDIEKAEVVFVPPLRALWWARVCPGGVLLTLRRKRLGLWRRIYITPSDPEGLVRKLRRLLAPPEA
jgi:hypothetical protein